MINGFEIKNLKSMLVPDGYITSCELYHDGKKVGVYFNDGMVECMILAKRKSEKD